MKTCWMLLSKRPKRLCRPRLNRSVKKAGLHLNGPYYCSLLTRNGAVICWRWINCVRGFICVVMHSAIHAKSTSAKRLSSLPKCWIASVMRSLKSCLQCVFALPKRLLPRPQHNKQQVRVSMCAISMQTTMLRQGNKLPMSLLQLDDSGQQQVPPLLPVNLCHVSAVMPLAHVAAARNTNTATGAWLSSGSNPELAPAELSGVGQKTLDAILGPVLGQHNKYPPRLAKALGGIDLRTMLLPLWQSGCLLQRPRGPTPFPNTHQSAH